MKRTIYLHGHLKDLHPDPIEVDADTVAEAVRSLELIPSFAPVPGTKHVVEIDEASSDIALFGTNPAAELNIRPLMGGAGGRRGLTQVVLGVALVGISFANPALLPTFGGVISAGSYALTGAMMLLGGLTQLMMPAPETDSQESSNYIATTGNTTKIGTMIPLLFGAGRIHGHYLSFDVDTKRVRSFGAEAENISITSQQMQKRFGRNARGVRMNGTFSYEFWRPATAAVAQEGPSLLADNLYDRTAGWRLHAAGRADDVDPVSLWQQVTTRGDSRGYIARYRGKVEVPSDDTLAIETFGADAAVVRLNGEENPPGGRFDVIGGRRYDLEVLFCSTFEVTHDGTAAASRVDLGVGDVGFLVEGEDPALSEVFIGGGADEPQEVEVADNRYAEYDRVVLEDDLTPILPVFDSPEPSPHNRPYSGLTA